MKTRRVFSSMSPENAFATKMTLADICNGIDCVSNGQFPVEAIIEMATHIMSAHTEDDSWEHAGTFLRVDEVEVEGAQEGLVH